MWKGCFGKLIIIDDVCFGPFWLFRTGPKSCTYVNFVQKFDGSICTIPSVSSLYKIVLFHGEILCTKQLLSCSKEKPHHLFDHSCDLRDGLLWVTVPLECLLEFLWNRRLCTELQQTDVCRGFFSFFSQTLPSTPLHFTPPFLTFYLRALALHSVSVYFAVRRPSDQVTKSKHAPPSPLACLALLACSPPLVSLRTHSLTLQTLASPSRIRITHRRRLGVESSYKNHTSWGHQICTEPDHKTQRINS